MHEWFAKNILGIVRAPEAKMIDIREELANGKSILLDSGIHSPMQDHIRRICTWAEYVDEPTVEFWTSLFPIEMYHRHESGRFNLNRNDWTLSGDSIVHTPIKYDDNYKKFKVSKQIETIVAAMRAGKKTIVQLDGPPTIYKYRDAERVLQAIVETAESLWFEERRMPVFMIQILQRHENEYIHELIQRLQQIAPTVVIKLVETPMPTTSLTADIHIVERTDFQKYLRSEAEVLLANNQRAVIATHYAAREFTKWDYKSYKFEDTPTVAEYNASFVSKSARKAFTAKHWERCHN